MNSADFETESEAGKMRSKKQLSLNSGLKFYEHGDEAFQVDRIKRRSRDR